MDLDDVLDLKTAGGVSQRAGRDQLRVLQKSGRAPILGLAEDRAKQLRRMQLPVPRTMVKRSDCHTLKCSCQSEVRPSHVKSMNMGQAEDLRRQQVEAFQRCYRRIARWLGVTVESLKEPMDGSDRKADSLKATLRAVTQHLTATPTAQLCGGRLTCTEFACIPEYKWGEREIAAAAVHKRALALNRHVADCCPRVVSIELVEARNWSLRQVESSKQAKRQLFFASNNETNIGDEWCTEEIMRNCQAYAMLNHTDSADSKSALVMSFCFDGVRCGKDFQHPYQQHSWRFANWNSAAVGDVWLTHICAVEETKAALHCVHRSVDAQLRQPDARFVQFESVQRSAHYIMVADCKAACQVLGLAGNSSNYPCFMCTQRKDDMYKLSHCRFTLQDKKTALESYIRSQPRAHTQIAKKRHELEKLQSEMGEPRTPSQMELSTRRIHKFVETCCIYDAINASLSVVNRSGTANAAELNEALVEHKKLCSCARRLAVAKVLGALIVSKQCLVSRGSLSGGRLSVCSVKAADTAELFLDEASELAIQFDAARALAIRFKEVWTGSMTRQTSQANTIWTVSHGVRERPIPSGVANCMQALTKLCRAAGGMRLRDLCSDCQPSVRNLCSKCADNCDKEWAETRDRGYGLLPLWDTIPAAQYFNENNPHHNKLLALANGKMMAGTDTITIGRLHFSDPSNACVDDWNEGAGYCTFGQIGEAMLKSIPDLYMAAYLLHTLKDVQFTLIQFNIMYAQGCKVINKLADELVQIGFRSFAWGPLLQAKVNGREKPLRESLNGPQSNFYYEHIDRILDATYGKNPPTGTDTRQDEDNRRQSDVGDKWRCKTVLLEGTALMQKLCSVIRSVDWTKRFNDGRNPVRECQEAYRKLHTWLYTEAGDLSKTSAAIQLGDAGGNRLFQGVAWHNLAHIV
jgi:hypothetical protein